MLWVVIGAAAIVGQPPGGQSGEIVMSSISSGSFVDRCRHEGPLTDDFCTGYIVAVADTLQATRVTCRTSTEAYTLQSVAVTRRYLNQHPERWQHHPAFLIREALVEAFPCRQQNR